MLLFTSDLYASITPDVERLRKFEKVSLANGASGAASQPVVSKLKWQYKRIAEAGDFMIQIGRDGVLQGKITVVDNCQSDPVPYEHYEL